MIWIVILILFLAFAAYHRLPLVVWSIGLVIGIALFDYFTDYSLAVKAIVWIAALAILLPLNLKPVRRMLLSNNIYGVMKKLMPTISQTEQEALDAGDVWWEAELFSGKPDFDVVRRLPPPTLTEEEKAFIDGPVEEFCKMLDDWKITQVDYNLSEEAWQFAKDNRFFAMIIPKEYGGLDYSAYCHSQVVMKIGSRSGSAAVTVMVPNSLGPGKLLMTYGTDEQKSYYLPRLAKGGGTAVKRGLPGQPSYRPHLHLRHVSPIPRRSPYH